MGAAIGREEMESEVFRTTTDMKGLRVLYDMPLV